MKKFAHIMLTLFLCLTCSILATGCEFKDKEKALTVTLNTPSIAVYDRDNPPKSGTSVMSYADWLDSVLEKAVFNFTAPANSGLESFENVTGLKAFRFKGGRVVLDAYSAGKKTAKFSYAGYSVEVEIQVGTTTS